MKITLVILALILILLMATACLNVGGTAQPMSPSAERTAIAATVQVENGIRLGAECTRTGENCP